MVFRIADYAKYNSMQLLVQNSQSRLSQLQIQASTARAGENYGDIASDSNQALKLENTFIKTQRYQQNIKAANSVLDHTETSVARIQEIATQLKTLLTTALNGGNSSTMNLDNQANNLLQNLKSELNKQVDGNYIFAGGMTNTAPVDITRWGAPMPAPTNLNAPAAYTVPTFPAIPATFPVTIAANASAEFYGYYTGNTTLPTVRASDSMNVNYGVTAADPAFAKLTYALRLAATVNGTPSSEQTDRLNGAMTLVDQVVGSLADMRSSIGSQGKLMDDTNKAHEDYLGKIEGLVNDIQGADVTETMSKLSAEQTQLQASFMIISRLSQVSLARYLQ